MLFGIGIVYNGSTYLQLIYINDPNVVYNFYNPCAKCVINTFDIDYKRKVTLDFLINYKYSSSMTEHQHR